ncbi:Asp23/Gls24 family envelope stress response protein [Limosilactobacillus fermentum]|uniref:Asp23/Gls24 family envelope stress response protein n=1 Tax=Limosilactobacillus fermentum TaxID=1613 RepID=UPI001C001706|nr:Asp23/Gls24 family envelope stress response protein [Limosilactobacillus fermentum]
MAEDSTIILNSDDQSLGKIQIAPRVIEIIAGIAANEIDGVSKMHGSLANNVGELLGRSDRRRGVKLFNKDDQTLAIDVDVYLDYGAQLPKVAAEIQGKVTQQVALMTDLTVSEVNVHVQGVVTPKEEQVVDPDNLFGQEESEDGED